MLSNKRGRDDEVMSFVKRSRVENELSAQHTGWSCGQNVQQHFVPGFGASSMNNGSVSNKRRRDNDSGLMDQAAEVCYLKKKMETMYYETQEKVNQVDLVNKNLQNALEEQHKELNRVQQESKLLKRSVLQLNSKKEEAEKALEMERVKNVQLMKRMEEMERALYTICMQQRGASHCRDHGFNNNNGGSGPIY